LVDDDKLFLASVNELLKEERFQTFNLTHACLDFFKTYEPILQRQKFLQGKYDHDEYDRTNRSPVDANIETLSQLRNNPTRHSEISVIILDYHMPNMTGLELARELNAVSAKKILLTGKTDHQQAIEAFNEGIIDRFIHKDDPQLINNLKLHVQGLKKRYFKDETQALLFHLEADEKLPLSNPEFVTFFEEWCNKNLIREYYVVDKTGNLLTIDQEGRKKYFIVHTDHTLRKFIQINEDENVPSLIDAVIRREVIPFFGIEQEAWQTPLSDWEKHFYKSNLIVGSEKYYWAAIAA
jgi:CheY-like chemotaxis protein